MLERLVRLVATVFPREETARSALLLIGLEPRHIANFTDPTSFWTTTLSTLDHHLKDGRITLLEWALKQFPGWHEEIEALLSELRQESLDRAWLMRQGPRGAVPPPVVQHDSVSTPGPDGGGGGGGESRASGGSAEPPPPRGDDLGSPGVGCPTLTLVGASLVEEFLLVVRQTAGPEAELLYISDYESAIRIPDPGESAEHLRSEVETRMRGYEPTCVVRYQHYPFQPYLYAQLIVYGPDTSGFELGSIPSTLTPEDVAAVIIVQTPEARALRSSGVVRVVIDHENGTDHRRLDPRRTLHECGVREGDRLRVGADATAAGLAPELRVTAVSRAVQQIRGYAHHHHNFKVTGYDDTELPSVVRIELFAPGYGPPPSAAGSGRPLGPPPYIAHHIISLHFPAMFPLAAPQIVWRSPVFHPNIWAEGQGRTPPGTLQFSPLLDGYQPESGLGSVCSLVTDIASYRDYDLSEGPASPNPAAAEWAETEAGQRMITSIGGHPRSAVVRDHSFSRPRRLFWLKPLGEEPRGR